MLGWTVGLLLAVPVVLYLVVLAINWNDRPVGAAAAKLDKIFHDRKPLADSDNAFIFLARLGELRGSDPVHKRKPNPTFDALTGACEQVERTCLKALTEKADAIRSWLASEKWLTEQYAILIGHSAWRDTGPGESTYQTAQFVGALDGQRLLLVEARLRALAGDTRGAKDLLEKDIRFWRMVLAAPNDLITKLNAAAAFRRHFQWTNLTLSQLPKARQLQLMPQQWRVPVSLEERSMLHPFAAEIAYVRNVFKTAGVPSGDGDDSERSDFDRLLQMSSWKLSRPLFQQQDFFNRQAELLLGIADAVNVDYAALHAHGLRHAKDLGRKSGEDAFDSGAYNLLGNALFHISFPATDFTGYAVRVADLEGLRRAAVLAAELRSAGLAPEQVPARLADSELRNPYTGAPFAWDAKARALVFTGLEPGQRGRYPIPY